MASRLTCDCGRKLAVLPGKKSVKCPDCKLVHDVNDVEDVDTGDDIFDDTFRNGARRRKREKGGREVDDGGEEVRDRRRRGRRDDNEDDGDAREGPKEFVDPPRRDYLGHNGKPLSKKLRVFAEAPAEIGALISVGSDLEKGKKLWTRQGILMARWVPAAVIMAPVVLLSLGVVATGQPAGLCLLPLGLIVAGCWVLLSFLFFYEAPEISFLGKQGIARFQLHYGNVVKQTELLRFEDANELRVEVTRHYVNDIYQHTGYSYMWTKDRSEWPFHIAGSYKGEKKDPPGNDGVYFARAAERAWTLYLLDVYQDQINSGKGVKFYLDQLFSKSWIRVAPDCLDLNWKGNRIRLERRDVKRIRIEDGYVSIMEPGAREGWFTSSGVYKFAYNELGNAQLFLLLLENIFGITPKSKKG